MLDLLDSDFRDKKCGIRGKDFANCGGISGNSRVWFLETEDTELKVRTLQISAELAGLVDFFSEIEDAELAVNLRNSRNMSVVM